MEVVTILGGKYKVVGIKANQPCIWGTGTVPPANRLTEADAEELIKKGYPHLERSGKEVKPNTGNTDKTEK